MKRLLTVLMICTFILSCNRDDDTNISALTNIIGHWELQSRTLNNDTPISVEEATLVLSEDDNIQDTKGLYVLDSNVNSSGSFFISFPNNLLNFENTSGEQISYEYEC